MAQQPMGNLRQRQAAETRLQLLSAACDVFEERGFQATSVGAITERANTAHGTFYLYFKNKEDVFCAVMESVIVDELAAAAELAEPDVPVRERIDQALRGFMSAYKPHVGLWRAVFEGSLVSSRVRDYWLQLRHLFIDRVAIALQGLQVAGAIRPIDPVLSAHALAGMVEWFSFTHMELREPPPVGDDMDPAISVLVDLWYHAVFGEVPS